MTDPYQLSHLTTHVPTLRPVPSFYVYRLWELVFDGNGCQDPAPVVC